jgi:branched-chain amino acid aminotransferase
MTTAIWVDGRVVPEAEACVSVLDHGLTVGDGVFETAKAPGGRPFALTRHLERLSGSARGLGLAEPDHEVVRAAVAEVLAARADPTSDGRVRITYTAGVGPPGSDRGSAAPTLVVLATDLAPSAPSAAVVTVPWPRNERGALAGLKTTSYAENVVALAYARARGASEAICADTTGRLCEGTGSNIFLALGSRLVTPTLATGCLAGVTRALVLEWCDVAEEDVPIEALQDADEVFLTSTTRDIQPVHAVDGRPCDVRGPLTARAMEHFAVRAAERSDP